SPYRDSKFPNGIDPAWRPSRHSFDFPSPCPGLGGLPCEAPTLNYPITLVTINVSGATKNMNLPRDPLPRPRGLPNMNQMVNKKPDKVRHVVFELCGGVPDFQKFVSLPSCAWYLTRYNAAYWGNNTPFTTLQMMRDADDVGESTD